MSDDDSEILQQFAQGVILGSLLAAAAAIDDDEDIGSDESDEGPDPLLALLLLGHLTNRGQKSRPPPTSDSPPHLLLAACLRGDLVEVRRLASHPSVSIEASPAFLHAAIKQGHLEVVDFLLKEGADKNAPLNETCPLHLAFQHNQFQIFKTLLNSGADLSRLYEELPPVLHLASSEGHLNFVELLVREGADVNVFDSNGTPLHNVKGNLEIAKFLVQNGADVNAQCDLGISPLHVTAEGNDRSALVDFLIRSGANVDAKLISGTTPLHVASRAGNLSTMKSLVSAGAYVNALDNDKRSPLHYAVQRDSSLEVIQFLVESGVDVWAEDVNGRTALDTAILGRNEEAVVKYLLSWPPPPNKQVIRSFLLNHVIIDHSEEVLMAAILAGVDVNEQVHKKTRRTPLHFTVDCKLSTNVVEILVAAGSNIDALDINNESPVEIALRRKHWEAAEYLLARSSVKGQRSEFLDEKLLAALKDKRFSLARLLIQRGANPNGRDTETRNTFLKLFVSERPGDHLEAVQFLLAEGADPDAAGDAGYSPLKMAVVRGDLPMVKALVAAGANVNRMGMIGTTPFLLACENGKLPMLNFLIDSGANIFDTYDDKKTGLHVASMCGRLEAMELLLSKGLDINAATELPDGRTPLHVAAGMDLEDFKKKFRGVRDEGERRIMEDAMKRQAWFIYGHLAVVRFLVEEGAEVNALDGKGRSVLHYFSSHGDIDKVVFIIGKGAKVDDPSYFRGSPLHSACAGGHTPLVRYLLTQGADLSAKNSRGDSPAATAALGGHWSLLPLLGVDDTDTLSLQMAAARGDLPEDIPPELINSLGVLGYSALHFGALNGHLSVVRRLLQLGADATLKGTNESVIHSAIRGKNVEVVKEILAAIWTSCEENGGHLHVEMNRREDSAQETPLMTAIRSGEMELVKLLAEEETVNVHLRNEDGLTAFHVAAEDNLVDIAEFLLTLKVDATSKDKLGRTPFNIAQHYIFEMILWDPAWTCEADPVLLEDEVKVPAGKTLEEEDGTGSDSPREEEETQGPQVTQTPITQQPFPLTVSGAEKETSEASPPSKEQIGEASDEKKEKPSSCLTSVFCCCRCCCSSN